MQILVMPFYLPRTVNFPCNCKILTIKKDYFFFHTPMLRINIKPRSQAMIFLIYTFWRPISKRKQFFESVDNLSGTSKSAWITKWSPFPVLAHPAM